MVPPVLWIHLNKIKTGKQAQKMMFFRGVAGAEVGNTPGFLFVAESVLQSDW